MNFWGNLDDQYGVCCIRVFQKLVLCKCNYSCIDKCQYLQKFNDSVYGILIVTMPLYRDELIVMLSRAHNCFVSAWSDLCVQTRIHTYENSWYRVILCIFVYFVCAIVWIYSVCMCAWMCLYIYIMKEWLHAYAPPITHSLITLYSNLTMCWLNCLYPVMVHQPIHYKPYNVCTLSCL